MAVNRIKIDASQLEVDQASFRNGVEFVTGVSPFDIPEEMYGEFNEGSQKLTIQFGYLDDEPETEDAPAEVIEDAKLVLKDDGILWYVGKHSGRLRKLEILNPGRELNREMIAGMLQRMRRELHVSRKGGVVSKSRNFDITGQVIERNAERFFAF